MRGVIQHKNYEIEYFVYGNGPKTLIAFHGFNNNASDFQVLGKIAGKGYSIIAVNLFFHGDSFGSDQLVEDGFSMADLKELFDDIAAILPSEKYSLLGYSMGGRIVFKFFEIYPERIERLILLAPDGIKISRFYRFLTQTSIGRMILKRVVNGGAIFLFTARLLRKLRFVSEKKFQFAMNNFDSKTKREMVYRVWMILRKTISRKKDIKVLLKKYNVKLHLFFGKYDTIIPPSIGINFQRGFEDYITLNILDSGHRMLKEKTLSEMSSIIS